MRNQSQFSSKGVKNDYKLFLEKVEHQHYQFLKTIKYRNVMAHFAFCVERNNFPLNHPQFSPKAVQMIASSIFQDTHQHFRFPTTFKYAILMEHCTFV